MTEDRIGAITQQSFEALGREASHSFFMNSNLLAPWQWSAHAAHV
jgi:hypothetical protein